MTDKQHHEIMQLITESTCLINKTLIAMMRQTLGVATLNVPVLDEKQETQHRIKVVKKLDKIIMGVAEDMIDYAKTLDRNSSKD